MTLTSIRAKMPDAFVMLLVVAVLTGCVALGAPRPVDVSLDRTELTVRLSDNTRCTGPVTAVRGASGQVLVSGSGPLQNCSAPLNYRVAADTDISFLRLAFEEVFGSVGLGDVLEPTAEVVITAPDGRRWTFVSPPELVDE